MAARPDTRLGKYFDIRDFACRATGEQVPDEYRPNITKLVMEVLEPIRDLWQGPITVVSGYRTPAYNEALRQLAVKQGRTSGVAKNSQHLTASAADIRPLAISRVDALHASVLRWYAEGKLPSLGGLGQYRTWIHVDIYKTDHLRRWNGNGAGTEP